MEGQIFQIMEDEDSIGLLWCDNSALADSDIKEMWNKFYETEEYDKDIDSFADFLNLIDKENLYERVYTEEVYI